MKVKIKTMVPNHKIKLNHIDFSDWQPFTGISKEDDLFQRMTYMVFLNTRKRIKNIYISNN